MEDFPEFAPKVDRLPPDEVRIREFQLAPYPDGRRVGVYIEVTPFQKRPSLEIVVQDADGNEVAQASIIEPFGHKMELTLHLRPAIPGVTYTATAVLFYVSPIPEEGSALPKRSIVDRSEAQCTTPSA